MTLTALWTETSDSWIAVAQVYATLAVRYASTLHRCKDGDGCEAREVDAIRELAAPLLKRMEN